MSKIQLFKSDAIEPVDGGPNGFVYNAGSLSLFGIETRQFFINKAATWLQENWKYDKKTFKYDFQNKDDEEEYLAAQDFLSFKGIVVLMAEKPRTLTVDRLFAIAGTDPDFFEKCYDAAVLLNPKLDPQRSAILAAQQPETKDSEGKSKTADEVNPLESTTHNSTSKS